MGEAKREIEKLKWQLGQKENAGQVSPLQAANPQHAPEDGRSTCSSNESIGHIMDDSFDGVGRPLRLSFGLEEPAPADSSSCLYDRIVAQQGQIDELQAELEATEERS